ncbi:MAG: type III PLP-dependent enzyme [Synergistaceae bacterium]|nr:type III PLP-dependent enzyme [Synergistaceae bacterium]
MISEYEFEMENYMSFEEFDKFKKFGMGKQTPFIMIDLDIVARKYDDLRNALPQSDVYYAVKANPEVEVLKLLAEKGSYFDVATIYEIDLVLGLGIDPSRISLGNTIKKASDIAYAYSKGVRLFVTDCESDARKIAENAPGSQVFCRILSEGIGASWPLSRKFGCYPDMALEVLTLAHQLGLKPRGVSFHVGSQQYYISQWREALWDTKSVFDGAYERGIKLDLVNIGGGFPVRYNHPIPETVAYGAEIMEYMAEVFGNDIPQTIVEPGRYMTGDSGILAAEVVQISQKEVGGGRSWMYLDVGKFGGMIETLDECIRYPIYSERTGKMLPYTIAGPTCDSVDVMYEKVPYMLPEAIEEGDRIYFFSAGSYTSTYCSVYFNGFPPLRTYILQK